MPREVGTDPEGQRWVILWRQQVSTGAGAAGGLGASSLKQPLLPGRSALRKKGKDKRRRRREVCSHLITMTIHLTGWGH